LTVILCNVSQAICVYTQNVTSTAVWDADFTEAVVFALAGRLAIPLTGDKKLAAMKYEMANAILRQARVGDANEGLTMQDHVPDWMTVRGGAWPSFGSDEWMAPYGPLFFGA
jgi:hypothetical protein